MKKKFLLSFVLFCPFATCVQAAPGGKDENLNICRFLQRDSVLSFRSPKGYVPSLFHNFGAQFTSPLRMKGRDLLWAAGVAGVTAALFHFDYEIDEQVRYSKDKSGFVRAVSPVVTELGNTYGLGFVGACGVIGLVGRDRKLFQTSLMASQAAITSGIWVRLVKYCTSRERPNASYTYWANKGHQGGYWYGFFKQYDNSLTSVGRDITFFDAFPSGHTSTAFAIATVFAMQYNEKPIIPIVAYSLAGVVGITRMTEHTHWASDVFVGAWAGFLCAKQVVHRHRKLFYSDELTGKTCKRKPDIYFSVADQFAGFKLKIIY